MRNTAHSQPKAPLISQNHNPPRDVLQSPGRPTGPAVLTLHKPNIGKSHKNHHHHQPQPCIKKGELPPFAHLSVYLSFTGPTSLPATVNPAKTRPGPPRSLQPSG